MSRIATKSNKSVGNSFEREMCDLLGEHGFWAHNFAQKKDGQPADIIALKGTVAFLIDCKECEGNRFVFSRIEENQRLAMTKFRSCVGLAFTYFFVKFDSGNTYAMSLDFINTLIRQGLKSVTEKYFDERQYFRVESFIAGWDD